MLVYAVRVAICAHSMAWKPGSKADNATSPDQDIFH
jgi:hypothetical protein